MSRRTTALVLGALLAVTGPGLAAADEVELELEIPELADQPFEVSDAQLVWGINEEVGAGAFAGGCNFLSAGVAPDTGGELWTADDFRTSLDEVTIVRPVATSSGTRLRPMTFDERCTDSRGRPVSPSSLRGTGVRAVVDGGAGTVDPAQGDARIAWDGSVSVVFYGGMTTWWFTDPVLEVRGGRGTLTATVGGYGTSREDMTSWRLLPEREVVLAELGEVSLRGAKGFSVRPAYLGVEVEVPQGAPAQRRTGEDWGSFPQSFVDFHAGTGQQAFWYSSGGARDAAKPATSLTVSFDATDPQPPEADDRDRDAPSPEKPRNPVTQRPSTPAPRALPVAGPESAEAFALPAAVPATTVLPLEPPGPEALATVDERAATRAPDLAVLALAALVLGTALTVLGYRSGRLVRPGKEGRP